MLFAMNPCLQMLLNMSGNELRFLYISSYGNPRELARRVTQVMKSMVAKEVGIEHFKQRLLKQLGKHVSVNMNERQAQRLKLKIPVQVRNHKV